MLLKLQRLVMALCGGLLLTSCVNKSITVNEVLQQKIDDKVRQAVEWITTIPMRIHYKISEILSRILDFLANITENINKLIKQY